MLLSGVLLAVMIFFEKIITANNTPDESIISKIPFEYTHPKCSPLPEKCRPTCADLH